MGKLLAFPPRSPYLKCGVNRGHPASEANFAISHTNVLQLYIHTELNEEVSNLPCIWKNQSQNVVIYVALFAVNLSGNKP